MTAAEIERIETELGVKIPEDYRNFLMNQAATIEELDRDLEYVVTPWTGADEIIKANREESVGPDRLIVATNGAADFWFLELKGGDPSIFVFEHETNAFEKARDHALAWLEYLRGRRETQSAEASAAKAKAEQEFAQLTFGPTGQSSMFEAAQDMESTERLAALIAAGHDVNTVNQNKFGGTPLMAAVGRGNLAAARLLLAAGADPRVTDSNENTSLHQCGNDAIAKLLLEHGADPNAVNQSGMTPLHSGAFFGREAVIRQLLEHGADKRARNADGLTPLEVAQKRSKEKVYDLLA